MLPFQASGPFQQQQQQQQQTVVTAQQQLIPQLVYFPAGLPSGQLQQHLPSSVPSFSAHNVVHHSQLSPAQGSTTTFYALVSQQPSQQTTTTTTTVNPATSQTSQSQIAPSPALYYTQQQQQQQPSLQTNDPFVAAVSSATTSITPFQPHPTTDGSNPSSSLSGVPAQQGPFAIRIGNTAIGGATLPASATHTLPSWSLVPTHNAATLISPPLNGSNSGNPSPSLTVPGSRAVSQLQQQQQGAAPSNRAHCASPQTTTAGVNTHPSAATMSPQQQAFLQQQQAAAQVQGLLIVVDPHSRKLRIPLSSITPTRAMSRAGIPSLCLLFLANRCRQGSLCHQVHANPAVVQQLREIVANQPQCCVTHGDVNESAMKVQWRQRGVVFNINDVMIPLDNVAFTNGLKRFIDEAPPHSPSFAASSVPPAALVSRLSVDDKSVSEGESDLHNHHNVGPDRGSHDMGSLLLAIQATSSSGDNCAPPVTEGSPTSLPLVEFAGTSVSSLPVASNSTTTSPPPGAVESSVTEFTATHGGLSENGFSSSEVPPQSLMITLPINSVCRLHGERGGCRFGDDCKFLHICREIIHRDLSQAIVASAADAAPSSPPTTFQVTAGNSTPGDVTVQSLSSSSASPVPFATNPRGEVSKPGSPLHFLQTPHGHSLSSSPRPQLQAPSGGQQQQQPTQLYMQQNNSDGSVSFVPVVLSNLMTPQLMSSGPSTVAASPAMLPTTVRLGSTPHGSPPLRQLSVSNQTGAGRPPQSSNALPSWQAALSPTLLPQPQISQGQQNFANVSSAWSVQSSPHGPQSVITRSQSKVVSLGSSQQTIGFSPPMQGMGSMAHSPLNLNAGSDGSPSLPTGGAQSATTHTMLTAATSCLSELPAAVAGICHVGDEPVPSHSAPQTGSSVSNVANNLPLAPTIGNAAPQPSAPAWAASFAANTSFATTNQSFPNFSLALEPASLNSTLQQHQFRTRPSSHTSSCCASPPVAGSPRERAVTKDFAAALSARSAPLCEGERGRPAVDMGSVEADLIRGLESLLGGEP